MAESTAARQGILRPAFYAARPGPLRDWWTLTHPPYSAWHLSYVVIGACLAPHVRVDRLVATVVAFFLAVGIAAHALDELSGRPLRTQIPSSWLLGAAGAGLAGAIALGAIGVARVGWTIVPFIVAGPLLVIGYNSRLAQRRKDIVFAAAWGAFPLITAYVAQAQALSWAAIIAAAAAFALSAAQRSLSAPARRLRRRTLGFSGSLMELDGTESEVDRAWLLKPFERALNAMAAATVLFATALALFRLT
ncbi:MAG: hypothetical protein ACRDVP_12600 [Acidimicrobiales bacterium]